MLCFGAIELLFIDCSLRRIDHNLSGDSVDTTFLATRWDLTSLCHGDNCRKHRSLHTRGELAAVRGTATVFHGGKRGNRCEQEAGDIFVGSWTHDVPIATEPHRAVESV